MTDELCRMCGVSPRAITHMCAGTASILNGYEALRSSHPIINASVTELEALQLEVTILAAQVTDLIERVLKLEGNK